MDIVKKLIILITISISLSLFAQGPTANLISPSLGLWVGCEDQPVKISIIDTDGIDTLSIVFEFDGEIITYPDSRLEFLDDTLLIFTPSPLLANDYVYDFSLLAADDLLGNALSSILNSWFHTDFDDPYFYPESRFPPPGTTFTTDYFDISVDVTDSTSGIVPVGLCLCVESNRHSCPVSRSSGFCWNPGTSSITYIDSTFTVDNTVLNFADEDSVKVCLRMAVDRVEEAAIYCGPNWIDTTDSELCWDFVVDKASPEIILDYPNYGDTIACDTLVFHMEDISGIDTAYTRMNIQWSNNYNCGTSPYLRSDGTNFYFSGTETPDFNQGFLRITIDRSRDLLGNFARSGPYWNFWVDKSAPYVSSPSPPDGASITSASPSFSAAISDAYTEVDPSSIVVSVDGMSYPHSHSAVSWDGSRVTFNCATAGLSFSNGDIVEFCITDVCDIVRPDRCGPNCMESSHCVSYYIDLGGPIAEYVYPPDDSYTACEEQIVKWWLYDGAGVETSTIQVSVNGEIFNYPDHLTYIDDTLVFIPTEPFLDGEDINCVLLAADDIYGNPLEAFAMGNFFTDFEPPDFIDILPTPFTYIGSSLLEIISHITDDGAGVDETTASVTIRSFGASYPTGFTWDGTDELIYNIDLTTTGLVLSDEETLDVCIEIGDDISEELCGPNFRDTCTIIISDLGPPAVEFVYPGDSITTACVDGEFRFVFDDQNGVEPSSIELSAGGVLYDIASPELSMSGDTAIFIPSSAFSDGASIEFYFTDYADTLGNHMIPGSSEHWWVFFDTAIPSILSHSPPDGDTIADPTPQVRINFEDIPSGILPDSFIVSFDGISYDNSSSALYFIGNQLFISTDSLGLSYESGDMIEVCVERVADAMPFEYCGPNMGDPGYCFDFHINLTGPSVELISPSDGSVTSCPFQQIRILIQDTDGVIEDSTIINIDGVPYRDGSWVMYGDTLAFTHLTPLMHGDTVYVALIQAFDDLGNGTFDAELGDFIVDIFAPEFVIMDPLPSTFLEMPSPVIDLTFHDDIAGIDESSLEISVDGTAYPYAEPGFLLSGSTYSIDFAELGLSATDGDSIEFCIEEIGDLAMYCGSNIDNPDTCWYYFADFSPPEYELILPDSGIVSACEEQPIRIRVFDNFGVLHDSTRIRVNDVNYGSASSEVTFADDTLIFSPTAAYSHGDIIEFMLRNLIDIGGNETSVFHEYFFAIDTESPIITEVSSPSVSDTFPSFVIELEDAPSGIDESSIEIDFAGTILTTASSGVSFNPSSGDLTVDPDILIAEESLTVCISVDDNVLPEYCGPNSLIDSCFTHILDVNGPTAELISPFDGSYSACDDIGISIRLEDDFSVDPLSINLNVDETDYNLSDLELSYIGDSLLMFIPAIPLPERDIDVHLYGVEDNNGNPGDELIFTYTIDLTPPEITSISPVPGSAISASGSVIEIGLFDEFAGISPSSINLSLGSEDLTISDICLEWDGSDLIFEPDLCGIDFEDGEELDICLSVSDAPDYCEPNLRDSCWNVFVNDGGPEAELIAPEVSVISACEIVNIIYQLDDPSGIDESSIRLEYNGTIYSTSDSEMHFSTTSSRVTFTASSLVDGDTCYFQLIAAEDVFGTGLETSESEYWFIVDISPPVITGVSPPPRSFFTSADTPIDIVIVDSISGVNPTSIQLNLASIGYSYPFTGTDITYIDDTLSFSLSGCDFEPADGESTRICIRDVNDMPDVCDPNGLPEPYCFKYFFDYTGPEATMYHPFDSTITTCFETGLSFYIIDASGVEESSIRLLIDGEMYDISSPNLEYSYPSLHFTPDTAWAEGGFIDISIISADDLAGNDLVDAPREFTVGIDTTAPEVEILYPEDGSLISTATPEISVKIQDGFAGLFMPSLNIKIDGERFELSDPGVSFDDSIMIIDTEEAGIILDAGLIEVCVDSIFDNSLDITGSCDLNVSEEECFTFRIESSGPTSYLLSPDNGSYSSCTDGQISLMFRDENGIDWSYLLLEVNDTLFYDAHSSAVTITSDSTLEISVPGISSHGDTVTVLLDRIADTLGLETSRTSPWYFITDIMPPEAHLISPEDSAISSGTGSLIYTIYDDLAGVNDSSIVFYTSNGDSLDIADLDYLGDSIVIDISVLTYSDGDTINYCLEASDMSGYCGSNAMEPLCNTLFIDMSPPVAEFINPFGGAITSCPMQEISLYIYDLWGIDSSTIVIDVGGIEYDIYSDELFFDDSLLIFEPLIPWESGDIIEASLIDVSDIVGNSFDESLNISFTVDLDPPVLIDYSPETGIVSADTYLPITIELIDSIAGIDPASIELNVNATRYTEDGGGISYEDDIISFYPESLGIEYDAYDTVYWCIEASDLVADYCPANSMTEFCDSFFINSSGPRASVVMPPDGSIISCGPGEFDIIMTLSDPDGIISDSINFLMDDSLISRDDYIYRNDTIYYTPMIDYEDSSIIECRLSYAIDSLGNPLSMPLSWEFIIDKQAPYADRFSPSDGATLPYIPDRYTIFLKDNLSDIDESSVDVSFEGEMYSIGDGLYHHADTFILELDSIRSLPSGSIDFCLETAEDLVDICEPNVSGRECISFTVPEAEFSASFISPPCREIISCRDSLQEIKILLTTASDLDISEISLAIFDDTLTLGSDEIELIEDTLLYRPDTPWENGDTVEAVLISASDIEGHELSEPISCEFYIDHQPPRIEPIYPAEMSYINETTPIMEFGLWDNYNLDNTHLSFDIEGFSFDWSDGYASYLDSTLSVDISLIGISLPAGDTITVCIDSIMDEVALCEPNDTSYCYSFMVDNLVPACSLVFPFDSAIVACSDTGFSCFISDEFSGIVPDSIIASINAIDYRISSPELAYDVAESLLHFTPSLSYVSGDIIDVEITNAFDNAGNEASMLSFSYLIDLDPPVVTEYYPPYDAIVADGSPLAWFILIDSLAGLDPTSVIVSYDGISYDIASAPGFFINEDTVFFSADSAELRFETGDTVELCIISAADMPDFCDANVMEDSVCMRFLINADGPVSEIISPGDGDYISCTGDSQFVSFRITDPDGIEWDSLIIVSEDVEYYESSPEIEIGDTCYYRPSRIWEDGDTIDFTIERAFDSDGYIMEISPEISFIMDLQPPEVINIFPPPYSAISDSLPEICVQIRETGSGIDFEMLEVTVNDSRGFDTTSSALSYEDSTLCFRADSFGRSYHDSVRMCIDIQDSPDLCDANLLDSCFTIFIGVLGPHVETIAPLEGEYVSCPNGYLAVLFWDENGLWYDSLGYIIDGDTILLSEDTDSLWLYGDTLFWQSDDYLAHGETLMVRPFGRDSLHNEIRNPFSIPIIVDTAGPFMLNPSLSDTGIADIISDIECEFYDSLSGFNNIDFSMGIVTSYYDTVLDAASSALIVADGHIRFDHMALNGDIAEWYPGGDSLLFYHEYDTIGFFFNMADNALYCGNNTSRDSLKFWILDDDTLGPDIDIIEPSGNIIAGDPVEVYANIYDTSGVEPDSIRLIFDSDNEITIDYETRSMMRIGSSDTFVATIGPFDNIGDTLLMTIKACDKDFDFQNQRDISCSLSDTIYFEILNNLPPEVSLVEPLEGSITSCDTGMIILMIDDSDGIDRSSIYIDIDTMTLVEDDLTFEGDSLIFIPIESPWAQNGDTLFLRILNLRDNLGNAIDSPIEFWFVFDFEPPVVELIEPEYGANVSVGDHLIFNVTDNLSGINDDSLIVYFNSSPTTISDNLDDSILDLIVPDVEETLYVTISGISDNAQYCGSNLITDQSFYFIIPGKYRCGEDPSPFTPNGDYSNPVVYFEYPRMDIQKANIKIYNTNGRKVREIHVDSAYPERGNAYWDGNDSNGKKQPPGLYLYIIERNGVIICKGSVVLAR
ncbi:MAG: gliding motility-associated C-terminal domain-containing protein [Candidatus Zixiibacteriota bacterium]